MPCYSRRASPPSKLPPPSVALTAGLAGILKARVAPAAIAADGSRPQQSWGLQIGDVIDDRAIIWSRADRASRMIVEWSRDESFTLAAP